MSNFWKFSRSDLILSVGFIWFLDLAFGPGILLLREALIFRDANVALCVTLVIFINTLW